MQITMVVYISKDYTKLIKYPAGKEPNDYHPNLQIIGSKAFYRYFWSFGKSEDVTIVIPWGVTVIEDEAFVGPETNLTYVIPDTAIRLGKASKDKEEGQRTDYYPVWVPSRHNLAAWNVWYKGSEQEWHGKTMAYIAGDHVYEALYGFLPAIILLLGMSGIKAQNKNGMVKQWPI